MSQSEHSAVPLRPHARKASGGCAAVLMVAACVGGYLLTPKWQALCVASNSMADPLRDFTNPQTPRGAAFELQKNRTPITCQQRAMGAAGRKYYLLSQCV